MIYRIDVRTAAVSGNGEAGPDPLGEALRRQIAELLIEDVGPIRARRIFLIDVEADATALHRAAGELLADPIVERADLFDPAQVEAAAARIEVHLKPGVMDPVAASTQMALRDMGMAVREIRTGRAWLFEQTIPRDQLQQIANRTLANGVIESVHFDPYVPPQFERGHTHPFQLRHVNLRA